MSRYLLLFDSYGLVLLGRPLWQEDKSIFCICSWFLRSQSFSGPSPLGLATIFTDSDLRLPFSSPPTSRRVTVEVFEPAPHGCLSDFLDFSHDWLAVGALYTTLARTTRKTLYPRSPVCVLISFYGNLFTAQLPNNGDLENTSYSIVGSVSVSAETCSSCRCLAINASTRSTVPVSVSCDSLISHGNRKCRGSLVSGSRH
jgi:hypothetical protein